MNPPPLPHRFHHSMFRVLLASVLMLISNPAPAAAPGELEEKLATIAAAARGLVGVAVELLETGETVSLGGTDRFPMQSVYKFPIAMAVLRHVEEGDLHLEQRVRVAPGDFLSERQHSPIRDRHPEGVELSVEDLLRFMVQESDGTACDVLLGLIGGPDVVNRFLHERGVSTVSVVTTEREMGADEHAQYRNASTPEGMVALLRVLHEGREVTPDNRMRLLRWMTETTTGRRRLKAQLPANTLVAHKTGTSRTFDGITRATNDAGIITLPDGRHLAIAVFVSDSAADESAREGVIAGIARAAWDHWVRD